MVHTFISILVFSEVNEFLVRGWRVNREIIGFYVKVEHGEMQSILENVRKGNSGFSEGMTDVGNWN